MDRGAWQATVHAVARVGHDLETEPPPCQLGNHKHRPGGSVERNLPANAGDTGSIPVSGISPREGNGNPLQYSYLGNPIDRGAWWAIVHGIPESDTT